MTLRVTPPARLRPRECHSQASQQTVTSDPRGDIDPDRTRRKPLQIAISRRTCAMAPRVHSPPLVTPRSDAAAQRGKRRKGKYANYFEVGHNTFEFVADFGQYEGDEVTWHTRVIMNPSAAHAFLDLLTEALEHFERRSTTTTKRKSSGD